MRILVYISCMLSVVGASALAADSLPVTRINISNELEDKVVEILTPDTVKRLAVDSFVSGGSVVVIPSGRSGFILDNLKNAGSDDLIVDGSSVVKTFSYLADSSGVGAKTRLITAIRQYLSCNNIKFTQFFCKNIVLPNCVLVKITSNGLLTSLPLLCKTDDWKNKFAINSPTDFSIDTQAGADQMTADFRFNLPIELIPNSGDKIELLIQDKLTGSSGGNLKEYGALVIGYEQ